MTRTIRISWRKSLAGLLPAMEAQLRRAPTDRVVAKLPNDAYLELTYQGERELLRIGRLKKPDGEKAVQAWVRELATFRSHLKIASWAPVPTTARKGIAAAFLEPATAVAQDALL